MAVRSVGVSSVTDDTRTDSLATAYRQSVPLLIEYLVIGGGGSGGYCLSSQGAGGGGAGGYRSSVSGENSGGGVSAESPQTLIVNQEYVITVGAGAPSRGNVATSESGFYGSSSRFNSVISSGGGPGAGRGNGTDFGGSGGGGRGDTAARVGGPGIAGQGYAGGNGFSSATISDVAGGGGGGAGALGNNAAQDVGGSGGGGSSSSITGTVITRGGGGGGCTSYSAVASGGTTQGTGGSGGGGSAVASTPTSPYNATSDSGVANTGGGGGGVSVNNPAIGNPGYSGAGGSGIVILKYPKEYTATFSVGVTQSTTVLGNFKVSEVTATSTVSETVNFT